VCVEAFFSFPSDSYFSAGSDFGDNAEPKYAGTVVNGTDIRNDRHLARAGDGSVGRGGAGNHSRNPRTGGTHALRRNEP